MTILDVPIGALEACTDFYIEHVLLEDTKSTPQIKDYDQCRVCEQCLHVIRKWRSEDTFRIQKSEHRKIVRALNKKLMKCSRSDAEKIAMQTLHECLAETAKGFDIFK